MNLKILYIFSCGKSLVEDLDDKKEYYMDNWRESLRTAGKTAYSPMNLQCVLIDTSKYKNESFESLEDAERFITVTILDYTVSNLERGILDKRTGKRVITPETELLIGIYKRKIQKMGKA